AGQAHHPHLHDAAHGPGGRRPAARPQGAEDGQRGPAGQEHDEEDPQRRVAAEEALPGLLAPVGNGPDGPPAFLFRARRGLGGIHRLTRRQVFSRRASRTVVKAKMIEVATVMRSRLRSTTVDPAIDPPAAPPNMSDRPPPRPEWRRISSISRPETIRWTTMMMAFSTAS